MCCCSLTATLALNYLPTSPVTPGSNPRRVASKTINSLIKAKHVELRNTLQKEMSQKIKEWREKPLWQKLNFKKDCCCVSGRYGNHGPLACCHGNGCQWEDRVNKYSLQLNQCL